MGLFARLASAEGCVRVSVIDVVAEIEGEFGLVGISFGGGIVGGVGGFVGFKEVNEKVDFGTVLRQGEGRSWWRASLRDWRSRRGLAGGIDEGVGQG